MEARKSIEIYRQRINRVIDHVRENVAEPLPLEKLARLAHFSPFHFHRIFKSLTGEPLHTFVQRMRLEHALFQMSNGPKATLTQIALRSGFASSSDFSRAFKQAYGFSPRGYSREQFLKNSKIRQDLFVNARYGFGKLPNASNPDRFRVQLVERPLQRIAYVRVIGAFDWKKQMAGFDRLMAWGRRHGLVPSAPLIGMSRDDPDITPMHKYQFEWCLVLPPDFRSDGDIDLGTIPANRFAVARMVGDVHKEDRLLRWLFQVWLPRSGLQPTRDPAMEVYRRHPLELGWKAFDIDCCIPVKPL